MFGWLGYTHGPGIDVPLEIIRLNHPAEPFVVIPHYNYRGVADAGTDRVGNRVGCAPGQQFGCNEYGWPGIFGAAFLDANHTDDGAINPPVWLGSLVQNQRDQSGLLYMRNRYYDPSTGQFTQKDPIGLAGGLNLYGFGTGDPINFSDPFGLCPPIELCQLLITNPALSAHGEGSSVVITRLLASEVRSGGTRAWRNNNPDNIREGRFTRSRGSIGRAGGFAVFGGESAGQGALVDLLETDAYQSLTINAAIARYAPDIENDTEAYQAFIQGVTGFSSDTRLSELTEGQLNGVANAIRRFEGFREGTVEIRGR